MGVKRWSEELGMNYQRYTFICTGQIFSTILELTKTLKARKNYGSCAVNSSLRAVFKKRHRVPDGMVQHDGQFLQYQAQTKQSMQFVQIRMTQLC